MATFYIIIVIVMNLIIITISFMQGISVYVRETNHASREYSVAATL
jgi:hypothetical protein